MHLTITCLLRLSTLIVLTSLPITLLSCLRTWVQKRRIALIQRDAALLAWLLAAPFECIGPD